MKLYDDDLYNDGMLALLFSCRPCLATVYYDLYIIYGCL